jgi:hypothetical protein
MSPDESKVSGVEKNERQGRQKARVGRAQEKVRSARDVK